MKVGTLCYATDQGLGVLAKDFYDHGIVTHPLVIGHAHRPTHLDWYLGAPTVPARKLEGHYEKKLLLDFCRSVDAMLFFETPFHWELLPHCKAHGVKTVLMPMYECMPEHLPHCPDLMLCPSALDLKYYPNERWTCGTTRSVFLPIPVDTKKFPWVRRQTANLFVHNAGHGGLKGRNGTVDVLNAMELVKSPAKLLVRSQSNTLVPDKLVRGGNVQVVIGTCPQQELYSVGDVFLFPERFNGLSLPLQEACASGMCVMATNRFPMNEWLPREPLLPVHHVDKNRISGRCNEFEESVVGPRDIAAKIDEWYGKDITQYSELGQVWAKANSWEMLGPKYLELLGELVAKV